MAIKMSTNSEETKPLLRPVSDVETEFKNVVINPRGLSVISCAVFIVAQMAGSGILALPDAISGTGWTGVFLLIFFASLACYCGILLGKCWIIIKKNHEVPGHIRDPYPLIGFYGGGKKGKYVVEFCLMLTLIGVSVVFLLLASREIASILNVKIGSFNTVKTEFRVWIIVCGALLIPCTWFASPKEMWFVAYGASLCTILACFLIVIRAIMHISYAGAAPSSSRNTPTTKSFFQAFGTIAFSYGGGAIFPTFQSDMENPSKFIYAAMLGFVGVLSLYIPVSVLPYIGLGSNLDPNILQTMKHLDGPGRKLITAAECLITFHLLLAFIIVNNPIAQQIEEHMGVEHKFGWKRTIIRSLVVLFVIGLAELFPSFGPILSFIGASSITMLSFVLPIVFYHNLQPRNAIPFHQKVLHVEIVLLAVLCGCLSMYFAVQGFANPFKA